MGEAPWRVEVATSATTSLTGRLTPAQATRLAQTAVGDDGLTLTITHATLVSLPRSEAQQHRFRCTAGGRVLLHWANGPFGADLDIPVHQVIAVITVRPADVPQSITVQIEAIDAVVPLFGSRLGPTAERAINRSVVKRLQEQPLPTWLPWDADVSVIVEAQATTEL